ncbi:MAG: BlaI/MecI/CopY family transcriptional regulator [Gemmatimonadales bacterium]|jgi:predicted transcriptional regulator
MGETSWPPEGVSGREREILDIIYRRGAATAAEVQEELTDPPVYGAVRTMLSRLEAKGHITHRQEGPRYVYEPTVAPRRARELAFQWLARTFFSGSAVDAAAAALDHAATEMSGDELTELSALVDRMRKAEREGES